MEYEELRQEMEELRGVLYREVKERRQEAAVDR